jgi:hypothetical protein
VKVMGAILGLMLLVDIIFRSSDGVKQLATIPASPPPAPVAVATPAPVIPPPRPFDAPTKAAEPTVVASSNQPARAQPISVPYGSQANGIGKATADVKGRASVTMPTNTPPKKATGKKSSQPPLPIALPE